MNEWVYLDELRAIQEQLKRTLKRLEETGYWSVDLATETKAQCQRHDELKRLIAIQAIREKLGAVMHT